MSATPLPGLVDGMLASYRRDPRAQHVNRRFLPSRDEILEIVRLLLELFYPGYFGRQDLTDENLPFHVGTLLSRLREKLERQVETCLVLLRGVRRTARGVCSEEARRVAARFLERLPAVRDALVLDVQAAYDGDRRGLEPRRGDPRLPGHAGGDRASRAPTSCTPWGSR